MRDIWIISDTHFGHNNILNFKDGEGNPVREFSDVHQMNETMVQNWNKVVKPGDLVYHLGDVFFGSKEDFVGLWSRLNGRKRLVVGNHDDVKYLCQGNFFQKVMMWRRFPEHNLILTHTPLHPTTLGEGRFERGVFNVHGHIHQNKSPSVFHQCVSVEQINYTPVHIEEVGYGSTLWT